ncbi:MAG: ATP synthase F1 subunit delta [Bacteroidetes bacterium CG12_big_fil_rev_8_21_14_0_65_60_17]|nr:MAG: ATP synthase F1 subunit delta [Bacteroidetes bacterium CG12_big_fil_rev_8_21_14_0_65_60_17]
MSQTTVFRRYAQALLSEAADTDRADVIDADVAVLREALVQSRELRWVFESPIISRDRKRAVVRSVFDGKVSGLMLRFALLLVDKKREPLMDDILDAYHTLRNAQLGITDIEVRTPFELSADDEKTLSEALQKKTGGRVRLDIQLSPELIGGMVIRIGDQVHDGSAVNQLATLRERLTA